MLAAFEHSDFSTDELLENRRGRVSVCVPTRETAGRIGNTVEKLLPLCEAGLVDELLVIDADSEDGTADEARRAGAQVHSENALMPAFGPCRGKGDAMWRTLSVAEGEIVIFIDGDVADVGPHYILGLLGPLLKRDELSFVKGFYQRPFSTREHEIEDGGGRVTELTAKPLLELAVPELGQFRQPLAGELAGRRELFERLPFMTGYGVEIAMLVHVWARVGLKGMSQVNLGSKRNDHQSLAGLGKMAREVLEGLATTLAQQADDRLGEIRPAAEYEARLDLRPPMREAHTLPDR